MKALCWHGTNDVRIDTVPDPILINDRDVIIRVTTTAICGSDLHIYNGLVPTMEKGDILGHEFMGEIVEIGSAVKKRFKLGNRVVVPFTISCGNCFFCNQDLFSLCELSNPNYLLAEKKLGHFTAGLFGFSHLMGGFSGGQAEFVRVPFADIGLIKIPNELSDEKAIFLSDILPTGYMAAENCDIQKGDTIAIWGCGPVGQFAIQSAWMLGAGRVIGIDSIPERLEMAEKLGNAEVIHFEEDNVYDRLLTMTEGRGPDACIDAVGAEAHAPSWNSFVDQAKEAIQFTSGSAHCLREAITCCRSGGRLSIPGAYMGNVDNIPFGSAMNRGLSFKTGQTHVRHYTKLLLKKIMENKLDPSQIITHHFKLNDAPKAYKIFNDKKYGCIKAIMSP